MVIIVIIVTLSIIIFDWQILLKNTGTMEKTVYLSLMSVSFIVMILYSIGIDMPSLSLAIETVLNSIFHIHK